MKYLITIIVAICLTGCVTRYVELPSELTADMETHTRKDASLDEAVNLANKRGEVIIEGNERFQKIRELQGTKVKRSTKPADVENGTQDQ